MAHNPEQVHNHNLDSVALNNPCLVSQLRVVRHNGTKYRESGTREQNCFYLCCLCRLQHTFQIVDGDWTPHGAWGPTIDVFDTGGERSWSSDIVS
jgi:hypothetical protein